MADTVFYVDALPEGDSTTLDGTAGRHAATVRRIGVGEQLVLSDGRGGLAEATVSGAGRDRLDLTVTNRSWTEPPIPRVTLVQALPKSERSELAVDLATEAGVDAIVPWQARRCVARWEGPKADKGVAKWRAAATAAAQQSRRAYIPPVADLHDTATTLALVRDAAGRGAIVAALHESATREFAELPWATAKEAVLIVGPEGGIDVDELTRLRAAGAEPVVLGPTVLRTSTAAAVALGAIGVLTDRWRSVVPDRRLDGDGENRRIDDDRA